MSRTLRPRRGRRLSYVTSLSISYKLVYGGILLGAGLLSGDTLAADNSIDPEARKERDLRMTRTVDIKRSFAGAGMLYRPPQESKSKAAGGGARSTSTSSFPARLVSHFSS
jgi:hypothetical protein